jgi:peptidoglycan hydrolase CwlO-like protein
MMERLLAEIRATQAKVDVNQKKMEAKMDSNQEKMDANLREMKAEMKTQIGFLTSLMDSHHEELKALMDDNLEQMKAFLGVEEACLEKREPTPEEMEAVVEHQEVPKGATQEERIGALKDRYGEQCACKAPRTAEETGPGR